MEDRQFELLYPLPAEQITGNRSRTGDFYMKPGEVVKAVFSGSSIGLNKDGKRKYRMRMTGETDLYYAWRNEGGFPSLYQLIDDALCTNVTHHSQYSLKLSSNGDDYPRRAYYKVSWPPRVLMVRGYEEKGWNLGLWYKKDNIRFLPGGKLNLAAEVYCKKEGRHPGDISGKPDFTYQISIGEGSSEWEQKAIPLSLGLDVASILVYITGEYFEGTVWIEDPYLVNNAGYNMLPFFSPSKPYMRHLNWMGHNLSKKEWPEFEITLNDEVVFRGEQFQRIYRWPVSEIGIPAGLIRQGNNELSIKLISDYWQALAYVMKKIEFISIPDDVLNIISCPDIVAEGDEFPITVNTSQPGVEISIEADSDSIEPINRNITIKDSGLAFIKFKALKAGPGVTLYLRTDNKEYRCKINRIVERLQDHVLTGTGDAIYINQNVEDMKYFLQWYLHHQIGNCITFRPVYRWSGSRVLQPDVWKMITEFCNNGGLFYCHLIDGREFPGSSANPDRGLLAGACFMGSQLHEKEGNYWYWGSRSIDRDEAFYMDIWGRIAGQSITQFPERTPVRTKNGTFQYFDPYGASSMAEAAQNFIESMQHFRKNAARHTGPSTAFKYLYQAGFEWLGAELMYNSHEILLSALRGASRAYGKKDYGAHLAVQWSTTPHDSPQRYRRYFLALYICYMQGVQHINTEEGLWRIEEMNGDLERFDQPCTAHRKIQRRFFHFVQTHSRRGSMHVPMAFLSGKYDGWNSFGRNQVWGQSGKDWAFGAPEESWDLLKVFYPLSVLDAIYRHPCPNEPQGYYTGTPYGPVDILPVEANPDIMSQYKILSFLGWNSCDPIQIHRLREFVENGGTLILGWPHLYTSLKRTDAMGDNPGLIDHQYIHQLIGAELVRFMNTEDGYIVGELNYVTAVPFLLNGDGLPLVLENRLGDGKVIFVNMKAYPSEQGAEKIYQGLLEQAGERILESEKEGGWLEGSENLQFTVFDGNEKDRRRTIYFMNIDWWSDESLPASAFLRWGSKKILLHAYRENINILTLWNHWAVWTWDNDTDIIAVSDGHSRISIKLQGAGRTELMIYHKLFDGRMKKLDILSCEGSLQVLSHTPYQSGWKFALTLDGPAVMAVQLTEI